MFHATVPVEGSGALTASCGDEPGIACRLTWGITHSTSAAQVVRAGPDTIVITAPPGGSPAGAVESAAGAVEPPEPGPTADEPGEPAP